MNTYCPDCDKNVETHVVLKHEVYPVKGISVQVDSAVRVCDACGGSISDTELDDMSLVLAFNKYREMKNLLMPGEIRSIREMYGLSQRDFARVLGLGEKTITRYENGSLQDEAQNNLILLMKSWSNFETLLEKADMPESEKRAIRKRFATEPRYTASQRIVSMDSIQMLYEDGDSFHKFDNVLPFRKNAS